MRTIDKAIIRIIDANFNRAKEALRVCEDVCRFVLNKKGPTQRYKMIRHQLSSLFASFPVDKKDLLEARDISRDVGRKSAATEFQRKSCQDIFYANSQRAKESLRVLEEFAKLIDKNKAQALKEIRYKIYALEKEIVKGF